MTRHRINRVEVELHGTSVPLARALCERVSQIHGRRIVPVLDRICDELAAGDELVRLDRLELDLGAIAADAFDDDFVARLEQALRTALAGALRRPVAGDPSAAAALEVLETFALTGGLPWWAPADDGVVARHFARAAVAAQDELVALLRRIAGDPGAIDRLARLCEPDALVALVGRVRGGDPALLRSGEPAERRALLAALAAPADATRDAGGDPGRGDRIAGQALDASPQTGGRPAHPLAARGARSPGDAAPRSVATAPTGAAPGVAAAQLDTGASASISPPASTGETRAAVRTELATARRPAPAASAAEPALAPSAAPGTAGEPALAPSAAPGAAAEPALAPSAAPGTAGEPAPAAHAGPVAPHAPGMASETRVAAPGARGTAGEARSAAATRPAATHRPSAVPAPLDAAPPSSDASPAIRAARRSALARLDELYVDDAGLVILWPFLERFFHRTGVLGEARRFVDETAQLQAVALLELLATADPDPREFRLPLAKLLCGRPVDGEFRLDRPLSPDQRAEADHLLATVIDRAPVGELSIAGLRAAFLQRPAALTTRDGAWLLQVERRAHDAVLDRFPWSWGWIKLPWMPEPLRVEW